MPAAWQGFKSTPAAERRKVFEPTEFQRYLGDIISTMSKPAQPAEANPIDPYRQSTGEMTGELLRRGFKDIPVAGAKLAANMAKGMAESLYKAGDMLVNRPEQLYNAKGELNMEAVEIGFNVAMAATIGGAPGGAPGTLAEGYVGSMNKKQLIQALSNRFNKRFLDREVLETVMKDTKNLPAEMLQYVDKAKWMPMKGSRGVLDQVKREIRLNPRSAQSGTLLEEVLHGRQTAKGLPLSEKITAAVARKARSLLYKEEAGLSRKALYKIDPLEVHAKAVRKAFPAGRKTTGKEMQVEYTKLLESTLTDFSKNRPDMYKRAEDAVMKLFFKE